MATTRKRRTSKIHRAPYRARVEQLLREDKWTLDEIVAKVKAEFPDAEPPSRMGVNRYDKSFSELTGRMREMRAMADAVVGELGEGIGEKSGALLAETITTLTAHVALQAHGNPAISIEDVRKLAVAAKNAIDTQRVDLNVRKAIRTEAREQLLREQEKKLAQAVKSGGLSKDTAADFRKKILLGG